MIGSPRPEDESFFSGRVRSARRSLALEGSTSAAEFSADGSTGSSPDVSDCAGAQSTGQPGSMDVTPARREPGASLRTSRDKEGYCPPSSRAPRCAVAKRPKPIKASELTEEMVGELEKKRLRGGADYSSSSDETFASAITSSGGGAGRSPADVFASVVTSTPVRGDKTAPRLATPLSMRRDDEDLALPAFPDLEAIPPSPIEGSRLSRGEPSDLDSTSSTIRSAGSEKGRSDRYVSLLFIMHLVPF